MYAAQKQNYGLAPVDGMTGKIGSKESLVAAAEGLQEYYICSGSADDNSEDVITSAWFDSSEDDAEEFAENLFRSAKIKLLAKGMLEDRLWDSVEELSDLCYDADITADFGKIYDAYEGKKSEDFGDDELRKIIDLA